MRFFSSLLRRGRPFRAAPLLAAALLMLAVPAAASDVVWGIPGVSTAVYSLAYSPDGRFLAYATDGEILVCDATDHYRLVRTFVSPSDPFLHGLAWSPDGAYLAASVGGSPSFSGTGIAIYALNNLNELPYNYQPNAPHPSTHLSIFASQLYTRGGVYHVPDLLPSRGLHDDGNSFALSATETGMYAISGNGSVAVYDGDLYVGGGTADPYGTFILAPDGQSGLMYNPGNGVCGLNTIPTNPIPGCEFGLFQPKDGGYDPILIHRQQATDRLIATKLDHSVPGGISWTVGYPGKSISDAVSSPHGEVVTTPSTPRSRCGIPIPGRMWTG